jgi:GntR family transcriptional regulator
VRTPNAVEAEFFNLPQDGRVGVYEISRTAFDQAGNPLRLTVTVLPTDRNQFIIRTGDAIPTAQGEDLHEATRLTIH